MAPKREEEEPMLYLPPQEPKDVIKEEVYEPTDWSQYYEEDTKARFKRKALENPFIPTGALLTASNASVVKTGLFVVDKWLWSGAHHDLDL